MGQGQTKIVHEVPSPEIIAAQLTNRLISECLSPYNVRVYKNVYRAFAVPEPGLASSRPDEDNHLQHSIHSSAGSLANSPERVQTSPTLARTTSSDTAPQTPLVKSPTFPSSLPSAPATIWTEEVLSCFLPVSKRFNADGIVYQLCCTLASFPYTAAPASYNTRLTKQNLLVAAVLASGRYRQLLDGGLESFAALVFRGLAVSGWGQLPYCSSGQGEGERKEDSQSDSGMTANSEELLSPAADRVALSAFKEIGHPGLYDPLASGSVESLLIPTDNLLRFIQLMVAISSFQSSSNLANLSELTDDRVSLIRRVSRTILATFDTRGLPGVPYDSFIRVVTTSIPGLFLGLEIMFESFFTERSEIPLPSPTSPLSLPEEAKHTRRDSAKVAQGDVPSLLSKNLQKLAENDKSILSTLAYSQLCLSIPSFRNAVLHPLYAASKDGYIKGNLLPKPASIETGTSTLAQFHNSLSVSKLPSSKELFSKQPSSPTSFTPKSSSVTYGAYVPVPWKITTDSPFSDQDTILFQLFPQLHVLHGSTRDRNYAYLTASHSSPIRAIGFGSSVAGVRRPSLSSAKFHARSPGGRLSSIGSSSSLYDAAVPLGPVSLHIEETIQYAVFTHRNSSKGAFLPSGPVVAASSSGASSPGSPSQAGAGAGTGTGEDAAADEAGAWQDRFEIVELEVWGLGQLDGHELAAQAKEWAWNVRESQRQRSVSIRVFDKKANKEFLRMAGIMG